MELAPPEILLGAEAPKSSRIPRRDGQLQAASSRLAREARCSVHGRGGADLVYRVCIVVLGHGVGGHRVGWEELHWIVHPLLAVCLVVTVGHPSFFVLDSEKRFVAKKLNYQQMVDFLKTYLK